MSEIKRNELTITAGTSTYTGCTADAISRMSAIAVYEWPHWVIEVLHPKDTDWRKWSNGRKSWSYERTMKSANRLKKAYPRREFRVVPRTNP